MKIACPQCKREVKITSKGTARCVCGAHIKVIDYKLNEENK